MGSSSASSNSLSRNDTSIPATRHRKNSISSTSSSSFSSCSSSFRSSYLSDRDDYYSPLSPATPLKFSGIPFSWEKLPGIPKKQTPPQKLDPSLKLLPLVPPPPTPIVTNSKRFIFNELISSRKNKSSTSSSGSIIEDPFFAAFVECCKDDQSDHDDQDQDQDQDQTVGNYLMVETTNKLATSRPSNISINERFGFVNLYSSCKKTCAVSESIVYLPRSSRTSSSYNHWNSRPSI